MGCCEGERKGGVRQGVRISGRHYLSRESPGSKTMKITWKRMYKNEQAALASSINLTQARVAWEEGPSIGKMSPSDWPVACLGSVFTINDWSGRSSPLWAVTPLSNGPGLSKESKLSKPWRASQSVTFFQGLCFSSNQFPPGSCFEFLF